MRWFIFIAIYILVDIYAFQAFRTFSKSTLLSVIYVFISVAFLAAFIYTLTTLDRSKGIEVSEMYMLGWFLAFFVPKLILLILMFGEDILRVFIASYNRFFTAQTSFELPSRRKFISALALGVAAIPFASLIYGMYRGKYRYRVLSYTLEFEDLPEAFDGYRITQISDIHSGSFDDAEKIAYGIDLINEQQSDVILFTGDLVNNFAHEMKDWTGLFSKLKAQDGVYSVLGNHDYGDYADWESQTAKTENLDALKKLQRDMGWKLLLNEHAWLERNDSRIALVGVENWGAGFKQAGDIDKATKGLTPDDFKVVMSHDPTYWSERLKNDPKNYQLTLSGHTHGMQFGIEIPGFIRWSPVQYRYENWAGIYKEAQRVLNVNRGFGYLGYPGRVGIWPEVTVIELRRRPL
ncbi:metallophosphoesterase [Leeuwenhoekiella nanhaiensis]|uniref:Phosphoesterase n=1 Tax=Leeuwenhoekiella nanhaiensis TaxID=1655491 RepID=A0A2G1VWF3_9FLAO|nr:metallophosphoesterase [Leeuwenhoekiella nanhaiensis]PHQ31117.1 phosphoesterase [Leeuwenhoekiella nanhaiensis]